MAVTPDRLLARMNASYRTLGYGITPIGALLGGIIGEAFGLRAALAVGAIGIACAPLWVVFSPVSRIRRIEDVGSMADSDMTSHVAGPPALPTPTESM